MNGNFDIDLDFGKIYEEKVRKIFEGNGGIEVKTERDMWKRTGNIAIEIKYKGVPSGLSRYVDSYREKKPVLLWVGIITTVKLCLSL